MVLLVDRMFDLHLYEFGVKPHTIEGLKGIIFMPLIHDEKHFGHILSNSLPLLVLLSTLIYFYREIALHVFIYIWLGTGVLLWIIAKDTGAYHIGMSGVIYGMFSFLLISGFIKRYLPLQAISLFVAFVYGSIVWGILPIKTGVSWQGHLSGLIMGILLALIYRKKGPQRPKYAYEIEAEMGIDPPDFEGIFLQPEKEVHTAENAPHPPVENPSNISTTQPHKKVKIQYYPKIKDNNRQDKP